MGFYRNTLVYLYTLTPDTNVVPVLLKYFTKQNYQELPQIQGRELYALADLFDRNVVAPYFTPSIQSSVDYTKHFPFFCKGKSLNL